MKDGWLWDSILKMAASPSPISITPAFSPGPCSTQGALVGSFFRCALVDLYEQCSLHITLNTPSSTRLASRPSSVLMRAYSSGLRPCSAIRAGVISDFITMLGLPAPEASHAEREKCQESPQPG